MDKDQLEIAVNRLETNLSEFKGSISNLEHRTYQLEHDSKRQDERMDNLIQTLTDIKVSIDSLKDETKASIHKAHSRIDEMKEEDAIQKGREQGLRDARNTFFKWIGAIVGIIAIIGYFGAQKSISKPYIREESNQVSESKVGL